MRGLHMQVILLQDLYKHGVAGEVVKVADGFARNYLIPRKIADASDDIRPASDGNDPPECRSAQGAIQ